MKKIRFFASVLLVALLAVSVCAGGFEKKNEYTAGTFSDVPESQWYHRSVKSVYELGLMNGKGAAIFSPDANVTVAEIITMTARARAIYEGETIRSANAGEEWYAPYVEYAVNKGYVKNGQYTAAQLDAAAKRCEVAVMFRNSMPEGYYADINSVTSIPDVPANAAYFADVLKMYNAGILTGSDAAGTFYPNNNIIRAEVATMIARVALPAERKEQQPVKSGAEAYTLVEVENMYNSFDNVNSGWILDNRGGIPRSQSSNTGEYTITDMRTDAGTAVIREFNTVKSGTVVLETKLTVSGNNTDGVYVEYQTSDGRVLYHLYFVDRAWMYKNADGSYTEIYKAIDGEAVFYFNITVDMENKTSKTYINGMLCGTLPLAVSGSFDIQNFRFGSTDESLATYAIGNKTRVYVNYAVNDEFTFSPVGYTKDNATTSSTLKINAGGYAEKSFNGVTGIVIAEAEMLTVDGMRLSLNNGNTAVITISVDGGMIYANGNAIYEYHPDIWYRLRIEADTNTGDALIKLNGRDIAHTSFSGTSVDKIVFANVGSKVASYDTIRVYEKIIHSDYVPKPVVPAGSENYTIGINICSLWRNGYHYGWSAISNYERPYLGYYDEGNPESADWEIKYMVEHGIDFQSFCWFPDQTNGPLKELQLRYQLHDAYMNAEYSDMMKYCLLWECANAKMPAGLDAWKKYYVPYMIENYFKDSRYMTIDNRLVLCVFGAGELNGNDSSQGGFSSIAGTREAFDYLEEEVKKLGFDGMLYLALGTSNDSLALMGFDGSYAYSWDRAGYRVDHNKTSMLNSYKATKAMYTVPTVSVGFNSIAWWGKTRTPLMSVEDYRTTNEWVRDEYLPAYGTEGTWKENFLMLSTWNEYGEGTYIMPSENNGGFGYLDVLRETYTDEKANPALNAIPTQAQLDRITKLYPQHYSLLEYQGYYNPEKDESLYPCFYTINAGGDETASPASIVGFNETDTSITGTTGNDGYIVFNNVMPIDLSEVKKLKLTIKVPAGNHIDIFFITDTDRVWDAGKNFGFKSTSDEMTEYIIDTKNNPSWKGTLAAIRVDPAYAKDVSFEFEKLAFLSDPIKKTFVINVDGINITRMYPSGTSVNGEYMIPFETGSFPDQLSLYAAWNKDKKELTLSSIDHTVVFTVGKDTYTVDGKAVSLGYELYELDGMPMIPLKRLCDAVGFAFREEAGAVYVETSKIDYFRIINSRKAGQWEFNLDGDSEKWTSSHMSLMSTQGYLHCESMTTNRDPILLSGSISIVAEKYNKLEMRVRYKHDGSSPGRIAMFFLTNVEGFWDEKKCIKGFHQDTTDTNGEWITYVFDLKEFKAWKDTVTRLRFDPFDALGYMDIDYIRFVEDPNWIPPELRPFELRNGNAEEDSLEFESNNGVASIENDGSNTYYKVELKPDPKASKNQWLYLYQSVKFKASRVYTFEYDIRVAGTDVNTHLKNDTKVVINCNAQFNDPTSKTDHVVASKTLTINDGWVHCTGKFTVPGSSSKRNLDKFSVYSNPFEGCGVSFHLDNVIVKEVE